MKNKPQLNITEHSTEKALHNFFKDIVRLRDEGIMTQEIFEMMELAICDKLHKIFVVDLHDAVANKRLMTGEKLIPILYRVCSDYSDYEATFAGDDNFSYDLWIDIIGSLNKMKYGHFYITNETNPYRKVVTPLSQQDVSQRPRD